MPVIYNNRPILPVQPPSRQSSINQPSVQGNENFTDILKKTIQEKQSVKLSRHAEERLLKRNISLSAEDLKELGKALDKAESKGIREALILKGDTAFVANVKNRTIITAATGEDLKDNIFTNIDGAIIM